MRIQDKFSTKRNAKKMNPLSLHDMINLIKILLKPLHFLSENIKLIDLFIDVKNVISINDIKHLVVFNYNNTYVNSDMTFLHFLRIRIRP